MYGAPAGRFISRKTGLRPECGTKILPQSRSARIPSVPNAGPGSYWVQGRNDVSPEGQTVPNIQLLAAGCRPHGPRPVFGIQVQHSVPESLHLYLSNNRQTSIHRGSVTPTRSRGMPGWHGSQASRWRNTVILPS